MVKQTFTVETREAFTGTVRYSVEAEDMDDAIRIVKEEGADIIDTNIDYETTKILGINHVTNIKVLQNSFVENTSTSPKRTGE